MHSFSYDFSRLSSSPNVPVIPESPILIVCLLLSVPSYIPGKSSEMDPTEGPVIFPHRGSEGAGSISHSPSQLGSGLWPGFPQADLPPGIWKQQVASMRQGGVFTGPTALWELWVCSYLRGSLVRRWGLREQTSWWLASAGETLTFLLADSSIVSSLLAGDCC